MMQGVPCRAMRACTEDIYEALMRQLHGLDPVHPLDLQVVRASAQLLAGQAEAVGMTAQVSNSEFLRIAPSPRLDAANRFP